MKYSASLFTEFLARGGPGTITNLQAAVRKLQAQLADQKADGRLERFRKLQTDLQEADRVNGHLRTLLTETYHCSEPALDHTLDTHLFRGSTLLYGASRELLLRENRLLRSYMDARLVTSRTLRDRSPPVQHPESSSYTGTSSLDPADDTRSPGHSFPARPSPSRSQLLRTATQPMTGPSSGSPKSLSSGRHGGPVGGQVTGAAHMEVVSALERAGRELQRAEVTFQIPAMRSATTQAEDGSLGLIQLLNGQALTLAAQKSALAQRIGALDAELGVARAQLQHASDCVAEARRQHTDLLLHQGNL
ncbi:MAG: hypothetical protein WDW38_006000 [Sanguina aurantia]